MLLMALTTAEARQFIQEVPSAGEMSFTELLALPYAQLYELHTAVTLKKRGSWPSLPKFLGGEQELGFGNITVDKMPNRKGEASLHVAPLPTTKVIDEFTFIPANRNEVLKFALLTAEDLLHLIAFYAELAQKKPQLVPTMLVGQTHDAIADIAVNLGFSIRRQHEHNDIEELGGIIKFVEVSVPQLLALKPILERRLETTERIARTRQIFSQQIRAEIIYKYFHSKSFPKE